MSYALIYNYIPINCNILSVGIQLSFYSIKELFKIMMLYNKIKKINLKKKEVKFHREAIGNLIRFSL